MRTIRLAVLGLSTMLAGCMKETPPEPTLATPHATASHGSASPLSAEVNRGVAKVRRATAGFHQIEVAKSAGYTEQWPAGCAESPEGAQAYHYLDRSLLDGVVELEQPELLMYEPQADGSLRLVGVDYFVPFDRWTSSGPPELLGQEFMPNETLQAWTLHIWAWRPNPNGTFAAWNPRVSCRHAS
jgi:hypothetical protein